MSRRDIESREDIDLLLRNFYAVVMVDPEIGHHFVDLDLETHLPIIGNFWEKVLFGNPVYFNNPLEIHQRLNVSSPLLSEHFERWIDVFGSVVDELFEGDVAETAKSRAKVIGANLDLRINWPKTDHLM